ncbi:MAG: nucleoside hydrolase [Methylobacteriaceae bacterium]|nr:nucleoside hydrolase [Methylobacteriaceae bacterium]
MTKLLIDCDPGHDDAIAILYAARRLDLVGVSTVFGNQTVEKTTFNALRVLTLAGLDIPVARGCGAPLLGAAPLAPDTHGASGLDGVDLPAPDRDAIDLHAVEFILRMARAHRGELALAIIGAHTNVALALRLEPKLASWLKLITIMGGTAGVGNLKPQACVNILSDPEAAHIVFDCGAPIRWVGYETTRTVLLREAEITALAGGGRVARASADIARWYRERQRAVNGIDGAPMHDSCAIAPLVDARFIHYEPTPLAVALEQGPARGMTIVDRRPIQPGVALTSVAPKARANVDMAVEVDRPALTGDIVAALASYR